MKRPHSAEYFARQSRSSF